jgi:hypothetical protein
LWVLERIPANQHHIEGHPTLPHIRNSIRWQIVSNWAFAQMQHGIKSYSTRTDSVSFKQISDTIHDHRKRQQHIHRTIIKKTHIHRTKTTPIVDQKA